MLKVSLLALVALVMSVSFPTYAEQSFKTKWQRCKNIKPDDKRLACYDGLDGQAKKAVKQAIKQAKVPPTTDFGLEHKKTLEDAEMEISAKVVKVSKTPYGKLKLVLDNEQRWNQTDSKKLKLKAGDTVVLKRGALGAFYLKKADANRTIKVKRVQ